jgi:Holliday junction resolvasome RuvABC endonuclease subunit
VKKIKAVAQVPTYTGGTVLAIDPGSNYLGWSVFDGTDLLAHGCEHFKGKYSGKKLAAIYGFILCKISEVLPKYIVCESYFAGSLKTSGMLVVPEVRGVIRLVAAIYGIEIGEIPYTTVQRIVTGTGNSGKAAVHEAVKTKFGVDTARTDESDGVAIGYAWIRVHMEV